ncbi:Multidrug resistance-associated protein 9 [Zancudomyces culisetae]|uniref:Multidrug resistance-associated protein 9 n=1 Tax=Zancudomyces culisetae TaxID=1213189 RepID=A0A1R1PS86_ZANCU|nr:Multidrug resistance-associated protein 9 [Zancudomyces culisetae]|eukprot:OMH83818.1 Multidrug resistance-associated protein 9 [Zancudomyces culisetae]
MENANFQEEYLDNETLRSTEEEKRTHKKQNTKNFGSEDQGCSEIEINCTNTEYIPGLYRDERKHNGEGCILTNVNMMISRGELCIVSGEKNSGKTALCRAILGELKLRDGKYELNTFQNARAFYSDNLTRSARKSRVKNTIAISYVSQNRWVLNGTIRENICFGCKYDKEWFETVVEACQLQRDIQKLIKGKNTIVLEKEKKYSLEFTTKISLARAVYQKAELYIFDDVFYCMNAEEREKILEEVIWGLLKKKTRIIVTNEKEYQKDAHHVLVLKNGRISDEKQTSTNQQPNSHKMLLSTKRRFKNTTLSDPNEDHINENSEKTLDDACRQGQRISFHEKATKFLSSPPSINGDNEKSEHYISIFSTEAMDFRLSGLNWHIKCRYIEKTLKAEPIMCASKIHAQMLGMKPEETLNQYLYSSQTPTDWPSQGKLTVEGFNFQYPETQNEKLSSIKFSVYPGKKVAIYDIRNSGTSNLVSSIFRLTEPYPYDSIKIDDINISKVRLNELRSSISLIPSDPYILAGTIRYNLDPENVHSDPELWAALEKTGLKDKVEVLRQKLSSDITAFMLSTSIKERQLLSLAKAVLKNGKLVIYEQNASKNCKLGNEPLSLIVNTVFNSSSVLTVLKTLECVESSCFDTVVLVDDGQVIEYGDPWQLVNNENSILYTLLYGQKAAANHKTNRQKKSANIGSPKPPSRP